MTNKSGAVRDNHKYSVCNCKEKMWNDAKKSVWVNARLKHIKTESKKTTWQIDKKQQENRIGNEYYTIHLLRHGGGKNRIPNWFD